MWCESGSDRVEQRQGGASLAALAGHALAARVCLLLPASEMIFRRFTLPKKAALSSLAGRRDADWRCGHASLDGAQQEGAGSGRGGH